MQGLVHNEIRDNTMATATTESNALAAHACAACRGKLELCGDALRCGACDVS